MLTRDFFPIENDRETTIPLEFLFETDEEDESVPSITISDGSVAKAFLNEDKTAVIVSPLVLAGQAVITYNKGTNAGELKIGLVHPGAASVRFATEKATSKPILNPAFAGSGSANPQDRNKIAAAGAGPAPQPTGNANAAASPGQAVTVSADDPQPESQAVEKEQPETTELNPANMEEQGNENQTGNLETRQETGDGTGSGTEQENPASENQE